MNSQKLAQEDREKHPLKQKRQLEVHLPTSSPSLSSQTQVLCSYIGKFWGFPDGSAGKESTCNAENAGDTGLILGLGRSPGGGHHKPLQYSHLENPMDRGTWWATVHGVAKSSSAGKESTCNAGDLASIPGFGRSPGEGKAYPLQCSGLENSMDCIVHGVTKVNPT